MLWYEDSYGQGVQLSITGTIENRSGLPLSGVSIKLEKKNKDINTFNILAFAISTKEGFFKLTFRSQETIEQLHLTATLLGYEIQTIPISTAKKEQEATFILTESSILIDEIFVKKEQGGFRVSTDTTTFNLEKYRNNTERNLEDILSKLPGMEVSSDGKLFFKGKRIEKILVGGDDFFSNNYTVLSKNIPAHLLDQIEAIENYDENRILKGQRQSDKTVLNISLKNKGLSTPIGSLEGAIGNPGKHRLNSALLSISEKMKIGLFLNKNTIGERAISDISLTDSPVGASSPWSFTLPTYFDIPETRYIQNNDFLGAGQANYSINKNIRLTLNSTLSRNKRRVANTEHLIYKMEDNDGLALLNSYQYLLRETKVQNLLSGSLYQDKKFELVYKGEFNVSNAERLDEINSSATNQNINQTASKTGFEVKQSLASTNRLSENYALLTSLNFDYQGTPSSLLLQYEDMNSKDAQLNAPAYFQRYKNRHNNITLQSNLFYTHKRMKYETGVEARMSNTSLADLSIENRSEFEVKDKLLKLHFSGIYEKNTTKIGATVALENRFFKFTSYDNKKNVSRIVSKIWLHQKLNESFKLNLDYELKYAYPSLFELLNDTIRTNYLNLQLGDSGNFKVHQKHIAALHLRYSAPKKQLLATLSSFINLNRSAYVIRFTALDSTLFLNETTLSRSGTYYWLNQFVMDYYFRFIRSNMRINVKNSTSLLASFLKADDYKTNRQVTNFVGIRINTAFLESPINFIVNVSLSASSLKAIDSDYSKNNLYKISGSAIYSFLKNNILSVSMDKNTWKTFNNNTDAFFMDVKYTRSFAESKFKLTLTGNNLLDSKLVAFTESTNYLFSNGQYTLNPRLILFAVQYDL
ncbi:hypothetical protein [Sphingobacterium sp. MYb382]|uniref:hypothetical protein n=1 Tax=Sphingobacterium sp. MYb382 TaxID=2745278 RepID=UPI00309A04B3